MGARFADLQVDTRWDGDNEVEFSIPDGIVTALTWLTRDEVAALREHLTQLLEDEGRAV